MANSYDNHCFIHSYNIVYLFIVCNLEGRRKAIIIFSFEERNAINSDARISYSISKGVTMRAIFSNPAG